MTCGASGGGGGGGGRGGAIHCFCSFDCLAVKNASAV